MQLIDGCLGSPLPYTPGSVSLPCAPWTLLPPVSSALKAVSALLQSGRPEECFGIVPGAREQRRQLRVHGAFLGETCPVWRGQGWGRVAPPPTEQQASGPLSRNGDTPTNSKRDKTAKQKQTPDTVATGVPAPPGPAQEHAPGSRPRGPGPGTSREGPALSADAPGSATPEERRTRRHWKGPVTRSPGEAAAGAVTPGVWRAGSDHPPPEAGPPAFAPGRAKRTPRLRRQAGACRRELRDPLADGALGRAPPHAALRGHSPVSSEHTVELLPHHRTWTPVAPDGRTALLSGNACEPSRGVHGGRRPHAPLRRLPQHDSRRPRDGLAAPPPPGGRPAGQRGARTRGGPLCLPRRGAVGHRPQGARCRCDLGQGTSLL